MQFLIKNLVIFFSCKFFLFLFFITLDPDPHSDRIRNSVRVVRCYLFLFCNSFLYYCSLLQAFLCFSVLYQMFPYISFKFVSFPCFVLISLVALFIHPLLVQSGGERVRVREPGDGAPEPALPFPGHTGPAQAPPGTAALSGRP